jgi:formylmethanofuran dehydrogenase subunit E
MSNTINEEEIICPYCDHEYSDSHEFDGDDGELKCDVCGKEFSYQREVEITYSTNKKICDKHDLKFNRLFLSKKEAVYGGKKIEWKELPPDKHTYFKITVCSVCDEEVLEPITKQQYDNENI